MKKVAHKKMTIDDLAVMVAKGFDGVYEEIAGVKREVAEVKKEVEGIKKDVEGVKKDVEGVKKDVAEVKENLASTRRDVLAMGDKFTLKYEFHDLASPVSLLEQKRKVKK